MKKFYAICICIILNVVLLTTATFAQDKTFAQGMSRYLATGQVDEGNKLLNEENYDEAIFHYKMALEADPTYQKANYNLGVALYTQEKYDEAIKYAEEVINANTTDVADAYDLLANIYDSKGNKVKCVTVYKKGLSIFPKSLKLHYGLASTYFRYERYAEAEAEIEIALKLEPTDKDSHLLYGDIAYFRKRTMPAVLGYCSFLMIETDSDACNEAMLQLRDLFTASGKYKISTYPQFEKLLRSNLALAVSSTTANRYDDTYKNFFAAFFRELLASPVFSAFARQISSSYFGDENAAWFKANPTKAEALDEWVLNHARSF